MTTSDVMDKLNELLEHVPTVYDCYGCKYNTSLIKGERCRGCKVLENWVYRQRPTKFEPFETTFTTQIIGENT